MTDLTVIALRALSFVASLQAAGIPLFLWLFGDGVPHATRPVISRSASFGLTVHRRQKARRADR